MIDDEAITYVGVVNPDIFVCMSQEAYDKLVGDVREDGLVFYDSDLVKVKTLPKIRQFPIPATKTAIDRVGRKIVANMVILGSVIEGVRILDANLMKKCIRENVPAGTEEINVEAFDRGRQIYREIAGKA